MGRLPILLCNTVSYEKSPGASEKKRFLGSPDLEEINVNGWDDIALTYLDGSIVKMKDHFHSPQHAVDIIKNKCFFNKACSSAREMPAVGMDSDARNVLLKHFPSRFLLKARPFCPPSDL